MAARRFRATLGYRGTRYAGWGIQPHQRTLQGTVESALSDALGHQVRITAAGRTDVGVHAEGQVISFDTASPITPEGLHRVLGTRLPEDVWVHSVEDAEPTFDARRSARRRWYRYALWRHGSPGAASRGRCLQHPDPLDLRPVRRATRSLFGRHDFAALVTSPSRPSSTVRTVFAADWLEVSPSLTVFEICADAFLKQMVRAIVGSLLWVGTGHWQPEHFSAALESRDRRAMGPNAPAIGLTLHHIDY
jgi:tRNA pseudouridine38-40 synthase